MLIKLKKMHPLIGAEVIGVDLRNPLANQSIKLIRKAWKDYGVLLFRNQPITDEQQVLFSRYFGELEIFPQSQNRAIKTPEIFRVSNVGEDDQIRPVDTPEARYSTLVWVWHTDSSYREIPSKGAILHAIEVVKHGGDTLFANMRVAYNELSMELKHRIKGLKARHSFLYSRSLQKLPPLSAKESAMVPAVYHPLVRKHSDGGRSLYLSQTYMESILGFGFDEGQRLIQELMEWATQKRFIYRHKWKPHDVLMWDNRWTIHVVEPFDHSSVRRIMHRTTIAGTEEVLG